MPFPVKMPCPICGGPGVRHKPVRRSEPVGSQLDATCTKCGWHYTSWRPLKKRPPKKRDSGRELLAYLRRELDEGRR